MAKWRAGRKVFRTLYMQHSEEPSDHDELIGMMDTPELAAEVVRAVNSHAALVAMLERMTEVLANESLIPDIPLPIVVHARKVLAEARG